jgi:LacI family transcriptional regulator
MAIGAMQAAQAAGLRVPDDVSVVGYDDIQLARLSSPALTTVDQRASVLGQRAAEMLFQILKGETPESHNLPVELRVRASTGVAVRRSQ